MARGRIKTSYEKPRVVSEKVFEQAALSCVVRDLGNVHTTLKFNDLHAFFLGRIKGTVNHTDVLCFRLRRHLIQAAY